MTAYDMLISDWSSDVCSADLTEAADLRLEQHALIGNSVQELQELTDIYVDRGVAPELAQQVAEQLTRHDALDAHARDELGISVHNRARPVQAALASAVSFATGAALPLLTAALIPAGHIVAVVTRSEEHTSELQSLMRISYAVFCLK